MVKNCQKQSKIIKNGQKGLKKNCSLRSKTVNIEQHWSNIWSKIKRKRKKEKSKNRQKTDKNSQTWSKKG